MNQSTCLNEQDLTLHYYGELADCVTLQHLTNCPRCQQRFEAIKRDLNNLPANHGEVDAASATRMAARVAERLKKRRSRRWSTLGATAAACAALVVTLMSQAPQTTLPTRSAQPVAATDFALTIEDMPDMEFLDTLEILEELELLQQLEGV